MKNSKMKIILLTRWLKLTAELQTLIEATLFGVGKSMSVEQLSQGLKADVSLVSQALLGLQSS